MTDGQNIAAFRESLGWKRRKLGSKLGLTLREMKAIETDTDPKPRLEKHRYFGRFIEFLGYAVRIRSDNPVRDTSFDLKQQQTRALKFLEKC